MQLPALITKNCQPSLGGAERMLKLDQNDLLRRLRQFCNAYLSNRKLVAASLLILALFIYLWPRNFRLWSTPKISEASYFCLNDQLRQWAVQETSFDVLIQHIPQRKEWEKPYVPFVGNGHFGFGVGDGREELRVRGRRALSLPVGLHPLLAFHLKGFNPSEAVLTDYRKGTVTRIQSYSVDSECVTILSTMYVHRKRTRLWVQDVTVRNPLGRSLEVIVSRPTIGWKTKRRERVSGDEVEIASKALRVPGIDQEVTVSVLMPAVDASTLPIKPGGAQTFVFRGAVESSAPAHSGSFPSNQKTNEEKVVSAYTKSHAISGDALAKEHNSVWEKLHEAGFGLSFSRAPDVLNGDRINATMYAVLSNVPAPIHEADPEENPSTVAEYLRQSEMCYNAHNTMMYPSKLWSDLLSVDELIDTANRWRLTLEKRGCLNLLRAGADGVAQAMVLSFGSLKYTHHHLELDVHPKELHRDYYFHGVRFGGANSSLVNIWVEVGDDNKALLYASIAQSRSDQGKTFFACDAACLDPPVKLGADRTQFPVKLTEPLTPILYVASDKEHLEEVKESVHVKEIGEAPAHEHHIIAMHKHGHRLGGLPTLFWVCLGFLIVAFHLFLFKLIFNEYCRDEKGSYSRGRYSV